VVDKYNHQTNTGKVKESLCKSAKMAKIAMNETKTVPKG
jgi:hypothetical protein